jgi:osmoprotectant transport system ATP-binding protein
MDEPFGAVDPIVRLALGEELLRIHHALGTTMLFVTHDVDEALRIADRIVVLRDGKIEQDDTPLRTLVHPATPYVENLLDGRDTIRRLGLLCVRDAMHAATTATPSPSRIEANQSLREALNALLQGTDRIDVYEREAKIGEIDFTDIRRAIAAA